MSKPICCYCQCYLYMLIKERIDSWAWAIMIFLVPGPWLLPKCFTTFLLFMFCIHILFLWEKKTDNTCYFYHWTSQSCYTKCASLFQSYQELDSLRYLILSVWNLGEEWARGWYFLTVYWFANGAFKKKTWQFQAWGGFHWVKAQILI